MAKAEKFSGSKSSPGMVSCEDLCRKYHAYGKRVNPNPVTIRRPSSRTGNMAALATVLLVAAAPAWAAPPVDNPLAKYNLKWTGDIRWSHVVDVTNMPGATADERFEAAQKKLGEEGGVVYFPAGEYIFPDHLKLAAEW